MKRICLATICVAAMVCLSLPVQAEVFKCHDSVGKVTYSDTGCATGTVGASIPVQENTVDSYGDRLHMEEQFYKEHRPRSGGAVGSASGTGGGVSSGTGSSMGQASVTPRYQQSDYYPYYPANTSTKSQCNTRSCQDSHESNTMRANQDNRNSRANDSDKGSSSGSGKLSKNTRSKDKDKDKD